MEFGLSFSSVAHWFNLAPIGMQWVSVTSVVSCRQTTIQVILLMCCTNHIVCGLFLIMLGIITGNPGVFQGYPYPYPRKPVPAFKGRGFGGLGSGFRKNPGVLQPVCGYASKTD